MTEIEFAQGCARLATFASRWAADMLDTRHDDVNSTVAREPAERFIREMRERLTIIEEKLNA